MAHDQQYEFTSRSPPYRTILSTPFASAAFLETHSEPLTEEENDEAETLKDALDDFNTADEFDHRFKYDSGTNESMLAVASGKGGVGKTTTALGLAGALGRQGTDVLVVDADYDMPNLLWMAGLRRDPTVQSDAPEGLAALAAGTSIDQVRYPLPQHRNVSLVPAGQSFSEQTMRDALSRLSEWAGDVILDCPAGAGRLATLPLRQSGRTLLVSTPRPASLQDTAKTAAMANALGSDPVGVVLSRCDNQPSGVRRLLGCPVLAVVPSVTSPLESRRVRTVHDRLRSALFPERSSPTVEQERSANTPTSSETRYSIP